MQIKVELNNSRRRGYDYKVEGAQLTVFFSTKRDAVDYARKLSKHYTKVFTSLVDIYTRLLIKSYKGQYKFDCPQLQSVVSDYVMFMTRQDKQSAGSLRFLYYHLTRLDDKRLNVPMIDVDQLPLCPKGRVLPTDAYVKCNELRYNL